MTGYKTKKAGGNPRIAFKARKPRKKPKFPIFFY